MKTRVLVYPVERSFLPVICHKFHPGDWNITKLVSPKGWVTVGHDIGDLDYSEKTGIIIEEDFEAALAEVELVLFMQTDMNCSYENLIKPKIFTAFEHRKLVVSTLVLPNDDQVNFEKMFLEKGLTFTQYENHTEGIHRKKSIDIYAPLLREISVPVLMVLGLMEHVGKFKVQLTAKDYFQNKGCNVALVTSKSFGELGDAWTIPSFFNSTNISETEKIVMFNRYIGRIEDEAQPDIIIIIGVPGGILPTNTAYVNRFGMTAFEITRAVPPDAAILCSQYIEGDEEYFSNLSNILKYRFSCDTDGVVIDRNLVDFNDMGITNKIRVTRLPASTLKEAHGKFKAFNIPIHTIDEQEKMFDAIYEKLTHNISVS